MKLLFKKVWRIQTITQLNLCSLKRPIVIGDQGYNNLFNGLFVRKILLTTSVPAYNHVKKQTTRQLIGRTILTSYTCKNCCIQISTCRNLQKVKIFKIFPAQEPPHLEKIKELTEKNYLLKPKASQDWCKTWTSLASKG